MICSLKINYNSEDIDYSTYTTEDQLGCNQYVDMIRNQLTGSHLLHVGVGTSSVYWMLQESNIAVDGITIVEKEIEVAEKLKEITKKPYCVFSFNKYDVKNFKDWPTRYSCIVDNNLKQHACCEHHWKQYWYMLLSLLDEGGVIVTHEQGFGSENNLTTSLTVDELMTLSPDHEVKEIKTIGTTWHPVVIRKKI